MTINGLCNKPFGPGGGTRRLHQNPSGGNIKLIYDGFWRGRNRIDEGVKTEFSFGMVPTVIGPNFIVANDNYAEARLAA